MVVSGTSRWLFSDKYKTQSVQLLNVKRVGAPRNQQALEG
jgi:hypothetical protein